MLELEPTHTMLRSVRSTHQATWLRFKNETRPQRAVNGNRPVVVVIIAVLLRHGSQNARMGKFRLYVRTQSDI